MSRLLSPGTLFPFLQSGLGKSWLICCLSRSADRLLPGLPTNLRLSFLRKFGAGSNTEWNELRAKPPSLSLQRSAGHALGRFLAR
jgi:hypothetical protein